MSFLERFLPEFEKAEQEFGVPKEIIAAIIGIESSYGSITGRERVIDSLSTLAFDYPRRSKFFTKQLEHFLLLTREEKLDPLVMKGSYAGAMGYGQFIPSSYRSYAFDFDTTSAQATGGSAMNAGNGCVMYSHPDTGGFECASEV